MTVTCEHYVTSLSGHPGYIENDARVIASSVMCITRFIQKHSIEGRSIEQFPPILGIGSIMWQLFQTMSASGWDRFKISPTPNTPSLVEAMRTLYSPSVSEEPSPYLEMAVDELVVEEVPFTTVTAKKHKGEDKAPLSTNPQTLPQNAPPPSAVVSRAPLPQPAKKAAIKPTHVKVATIPQTPKQAPKSFAQVACSGNPQPTPRFVPASAHPEYESLLCLRDMFPNLPMDMAVESCNRGLVEARSKLRVESVRKAWNGVSMSTNFVASAAELEVIKQWLKKVTGLNSTVVVKPRLPQSKSFLKILGIPYWGNNSSLPITQAQVEAVIASTPVFEEVVLASHPRIMKASPSLDMSVIWIDIWDSQKGTKGKTLINRSFNFG